MPTRSIFITRAPQLVMIRYNRCQKQQFLFHFEMFELNGAEPAKSENMLIWIRNHFFCFDCETMDDILFIIQLFICYGEELRPISGNKNTGPTNRLWFTWSRKVNSCVNWKIEKSYEWTRWSLSMSVVDINISHAFLIASFITDDVDA